jgi:serine/threonine protein kinase/Tol biopolymer transport system component
MPGIREEITKTFQRLSRRGNTQSRSAVNRDTVAHQRPREGRQFGSYRILKLLGAGGMGEVYLALDARLGRRIALKFLPPHLTSNEATLHRLEQEARTASALNHPNILTIYEVGQIDGESFIASEYIDGITLRTALHRGSVDLATALDVAIQVASALVAAHSAGVIHRDLKPGNIMIRPDGYVKVIDFGLAKLARASGQNIPTGEAWTRPGSVIGTVDYMSPEQARGDKLDGRTDLWSLGVVLYEMLAHKRPFEGDTESHILVGILDKSVPAIDRSHAVPSRLIEIINRALAKDRAQRYQTAQELLSDLHQVRQTLPRSVTDVGPILFSPRSQGRRRLGLAGGIIGSLILACAIWWWGLGGKETVIGPDWFRIESVRQLTFTGRTKLACISPDGRYLAFVVGDPGGTETLFLKQVDQASEQVKLSPRNIDYTGITFSPDSQTIFVVEKDDELLGRLYPVPILGDRPRTPILVDIDGPVSFSPSGEQFAFVRYPAPLHESTVQIAKTSPDGSPLKTLISIKDFTIMWRLAWAPKGDLIATFVYSNSANSNGEGMLDLIDVKGRESKRSLPGWALVDQPAWTSKSKTLIVAASTRTEGNRAQLREIALNTGQINDITKDLAAYRSASLTRDGQQLVVVRRELKASLWVSSPNAMNTGQSASAEGDEHPSLSWWDQSHLILNSQRTGFPNLSLFDIETQTRASLTNEASSEADATSIRNSKSIVFSSNRSGEFRLWKFDPESNKFSQLTFGPGYDEKPSVSPDGKWIVYTSWTANEPHLYRVPIEGGNHHQIAAYVATDPEISPDGKSIVCHMQDPTTSRWAVATIPVDGAGQPHILKNVGTPFRWSRDGTSITTAITDTRGVSNAWAVPLDGSAPHQLTSFDEQAILALAWSPHGDRLACVRASSGADAVLFKKQK